jgi:hypothetical protein
VAVDAFTVKLVVADHGAVEATMDDSPAVPFTVTGPDVEEYSADCGSDMEFKVIPGDCHDKPDFVYVNGEAVALENGDYYGFGLTDIQANYILEVGFSQLGPYKVTTEAGEGGEITSLCDEECEEVGCGEDVTFIIGADDCYELADLEVNGVSVIGDVAEDGTYILTDVREDKHLIATFSASGLTTVTIVVEEGGEAIATPGGTIAGPDVVDISVDCGSDVEVEVVQYECYDLPDFVMVNGELVALQEGNFAVEEVMEETTVHVEFEEKGPYEVIANATDGGKIDPAGESTLDCGGEVEFTITPEPCHEILDVVIIGEGSVLGDVSIDPDTGVGTYLLD